MGLGDKEETQTLFEKLPFHLHFIMHSLRNHLLNILKT